MSPLEQVKATLRSLGEPVPDAILSDEERFEARSRFLRAEYEKTIRGYAQAKISSQQASQRFTGATLEFVRLMDADWLEEWAREKAKARFRFEAHHAMRKDKLTDAEVERARTFPIGQIIPVPKSGFVLCPFHRERTPSCKVKGNLWYCHGCGQGGDSIDFIRKKNGFSFPEAVRYLNTPIITSSVVKRSTP